MWTRTWIQFWRCHGEASTLRIFFCPLINFCSFIVLLLWSIPTPRVRLRSDGAAVPRRQGGTETHSPTRVTDTPPRAAACPSSPHKMSLSKTRMESPEKRRLGTFGSAGSIYPDRKAYPEGHPLRPVTGATRHSSLGDHKSLEAEALAEVHMRIPRRCGGLLLSAPEPKHQSRAKKAHEEYFM